MCAVINDNSAMSGSLEFENIGQICMISLFKPGAEGTFWLLMSVSMH